MSNLSISTEFKALRKVANLSISDVARKMQVSEEDVKAMEDGEYNFTEKTVLKIVCAFRLNSDWYSKLKEMVVK